LIAVTVSSLAAWIAATCSEISFGPFAVWPARDFTSEATTGKPPTGFSGARRLDGRVQRQQVGLGRDVLDQGDDVADLLRALGQRTRGARCAGRFDARALLGGVVT